MKFLTCLYILIGVIGLSLFVFGVYELSGFGWSLIAGAASCFAAMGFLRRGLMSG